MNMDILLADRNAKKNASVLEQSLANTADYHPLMACIEKKRLKGSAPKIAVASLCNSTSYTFPFFLSVICISHIIYRTEMVIPASFSVSHSQIWIDIFSLCIGFTCFFTHVPSTEHVCYNTLNTFYHTIYHFSLPLKFLTSTT